jgi:HlyD family secretion protein
VELAKEGIIDKEDVETAETTSQSAIADELAMSAQQDASADGVKVAQADLRVARTQLAENQAQVKQFSASLQSAQLDLDHTLIRAPVDGVVVSRSVDVGQTVAASLAAPTLFLIAQDLTKMQVDTNVSEADVGKAVVGQPATFTVDAYPGRIFNGSVTSIRQAAINVSNVITYDVVIAVSNADLKLFPGMTANVKILVDQRKNVLTVPNTALRYHPASQTTTPASSASGVHKMATPEQAIWILNADNKPQRVSVITGASDGTKTEVKSGAVKDGDRAIFASVAKTGSTPASATPQGRGPGF